MQAAFGENRCQMPMKEWKGLDAGSLLLLMSCEL